MKFPSLNFRPGRSDSKVNRGFTIPEMLVAITVFTLLVGGIIFAHLYGLSMFRITETKLTTTEDARKMLGRMTDEIRTCKTTWVGKIVSGSFVGVLDGQPQQGTSLLIYPTTNTTPYVLYFVNPTDLTFRRMTDKTNTAVILADSVTNTVVFRAQDHLGNLLTNNQNNRVIHVALEFFQPKRFRQVADYYKLETSVTRRALE
jgi:prepilin-type N-terminal cleavage/methylation domain-containing protein